MRIWRNISWAPCRQSFCYADTPGMGVEVCARQTPGLGEDSGGGGCGFIGYRNVLNGRQIAADTHDRHQLPPSAMPAAPKKTDSRSLV